ncbi:UNVERIFIED_CONTAM: polysaccharide deacetylase family protein (PEP-CTERM system associated) [Paenibacillus phyllosphaerae]
MDNALTVDVEDYYMTNGLAIPPAQWSRYEDRIVGSTMGLLDLFAEYRVRGTFFVLGCVAERHPELVREIARRGHEIGSHGTWHQLVNEQSLEEFRADIRASKSILETITGMSVRLYRAPSWSIGPGRYEALRILAEEGFSCDSSIQPFHTPLSGVAGAPVAPFRPVVDGLPADLVEFPPSVTKVGGVTVPFSGGFYLRATPYSFVKWALKRVNKARPGMIYVHPWEIDASQPRLPANPLIRFVQYYGLGDTKKKLRRLLEDFSFRPLGEILQGQHYKPELLHTASPAKGMS